MAMRVGTMHTGGEARGSPGIVASVEDVILVLITITIWDLWRIVVALWGARMLLRCLAWVVAGNGADWRATAWRCQWEFLGFIAGTFMSAATLHLALLPGPAPDRLWPLALLLLGLRAALDLPRLFAACRDRTVGQLRNRLRWRYFLLRLWRRKLAQYGLRYLLVAAPRSLFARRFGRD